MMKKLFAALLVLLMVFSVPMAGAALDAIGFGTTAEAATYKLDTPEITSLSNTSSGVKITWGKVSGAEMYMVFIRNSSGWTELAETAGTSYTFKNVTSGKTYAFTVRCADENGNYSSAYNKTGKSIKYTTGSSQLKTPVITDLASKTNGMKVTWDKVNGAEKYRVFYKTSSTGSWKTAGDTTSTNFTVTGLTPGKAYWFTVRCLSETGKSYTSSYNKDGWKGKPLPKPVISKLSNTSSGVKVTWNDISGAENYRVFYKTSSSGSWKTAGDTTGTSYTFKNVASGKTYWFTVRCISASGKSYASPYDKTGKSIKYTTGSSGSQLKTPVITDLASKTNGMKVTWGKVSGAEKYRVFYKTSSTGSWKTAGDTESTSYTVTGLTPGKNYWFTVRCLSESGKSYTSSYDKTGTKGSPLVKPVISQLTSTTSGVKVTWGEVDGADNYRVFYKTSESGSWKTAGDTTSTGYTFKDAASGKTYWFTVRCISASGKSYASPYDKTGKSIKYSSGSSSSSSSAGKKGVAVYGDGTIIADPITFFGDGQLYQKFTDKFYFATGGNHMSQLTEYVDSFISSGKYKLHSADLDGDVPAWYLIYTGSAELSPSAQDGPAQVSIRYDKELDFVDIFKSVGFYYVEKHDTNQKQPADPNTSTSGAKKGKAVYGDGTIIADPITFFGDGQLYQKFTDKFYFATGGNHMSQLTEYVDSFISSGKYKLHSADLDGDVPAWYLIYTGSAELSPSAQENLANVSIRYDKELDFVDIFKSVGFYYVEKHKTTQNPSSSNSSSNDDDDDDDDDDDFCFTCNNKGYITCRYCSGDGWTNTGKRCTYCSGGDRDCYACSR